MIQISFDPQAKTLYWYMTEIEAGSTDSEGECDGTLLLDAQGEIIGLELELDESVSRRELALALEHPQARFDKTTCVLTLMLFDEEPAEAQPLHDSVIVDIDAAGRIQGCEVIAAETFGLGERLTRAAAFVVDLEDAPDPATGDGPRLVTPAADADDAGEGEEPGEAAEVEPSLLPGVASGAMIRSGFVALVGPPNVGKSTLLNALLGQKVAIVSPLPQTTRTAIRGILSRPDAQIVFVDTPGIHQPRTRLGNYMVDQARRTIPDADMVCMIVDITKPPGRLDERIAQMVRRSRGPKLLVMNKVDQRNPEGAQHAAAYRDLAPWDMEIAISALRRIGLDGLLDEIIARLPTDRQLYPEDQITDKSEREQASELIREQVLRQTQQEVPHGVAVEVEEWEQREGALYIRMSIYVEKESQKGILIGAGGQRLKQIGSAARKQIEELLGQQVFLDLWVKTRANWRDDPNALHWLGYKG